MKYIKVVLLVFLLLVGGSFVWRYCAKKNDTRKLLEVALNRANDNRKKLEKVLEHYRREPADALKYKAACFLIMNMPYYYSYTSNDVVDSLKRLKVKNQGRPIDAKTIEQWKWFKYQSLPKKRDADVITADLLIENIDYAFMAWRKRPWSKCYSFEDFCEYVLPYRIADEALEKWRKVYYDRYSPVLDSLYSGSDVVEAANRMASYLRAEHFYNRMDFELPHFGALFLLENRVGYCRDECDVATYVMRALGIPVATDMYHTSPSYRSRHYWSAVIDTTGRSVSFNYSEYSPKRGVYDDRKRGKVYRQFFGIQKKNRKLVNDINVPNVFRNPFSVDVTGEYYPDNGFSVNIKGNRSEDKYVYLAVYDYNSYVPIDMAVLKGKTAKFKNVEKGLIYHPVFCRNGEMFPAGYPFLLEENAMVHSFIPRSEKTHREQIVRKYPMRDNLKFFATAVGTKFEGSRTFDFTSSDVLYEVVDTPQINYNRIRFSEPHSCRYIRVSQKHERMEIAELELYADEKKQTVLKWGRDRYNMCNLSYEKVIFDGNWEKYIVTFNEPLYLDLGHVADLTELVFVPRNDDNFIHLGDVYELFYQDGPNGWRSLGRKTADTPYLQYHVPENSLLWLHNLTRGKEERPFYMKDRKQIFP